MNETKNTASAVAATKLCTAFYPEDMLAIEHDLIQNCTIYEGELRLAYIDGINDAFEAVLERMKKRAEE